MKKNNFKNWGLLDDLIIHFMKTNKMGTNIARAKVAEKTYDYFDNIGIFDIIKEEIKITQLERRIRTIRDLGLIDKKVDISIKDYLFYLQLFYSELHLKNKKTQEQSEKIRNLLDNYNIEDIQNKKDFYNEIRDIYNKNTNFLRIKNKTKEFGIKLTKGEIEGGFHSLEYGKKNIMREREYIKKDIDTYFENIIKTQLNDARKEDFILYIGENIINKDKIRESNYLKALNNIELVIDVANSINANIIRLNQVFKRVKVIIVYREIVDTENEGLNDIIFDNNHMLGGFVQNAEVELINGGSIDEYFYNGSESISTPTKDTLQNLKKFHNNLILTTKVGTNIKYENIIPVLVDMDVLNIICFRDREITQENYGFLEKSFSPSLKNKMLFSGEDVYFL